MKKQVVLPLALSLLFPLQSFAAETILSEVTLSFTNTGQTDRAVLMAGEEDADLYLYLGTPKGYSAPLIKKAFVYNGSMAGTHPSLAVGRKGSLQVNSENIGVGRNHWEQTLTIVYRNHEFVIGGITYSSRDTLDPDAGGNCDLNLLTGKGTRNGKPVTVTLKPVRVTDWSDELLPKACQF
jgi:hypothetical protein